jgi:hypothetical protein
MTPGSRLGDDRVAPCWHSTSLAPSSFSSSRICIDRAGWLTAHSSAARPKGPWRANASRYCNWRRGSIAIRYVTAAQGYSAALLPRAGAPCSASCQKYRRGHPRSRPSSRCVDWRSASHASTFWSSTWHSTNTLPNSAAFLTHRASHAGPRQQKRQEIARRLLSCEICATVTCL